MSFDPQLTATITETRASAVGDMLRRTAARAPRKVALIDGQTTLTYAEFDRMVNRFANFLLDEGVERRTRLALLSRNCWQFAVASFASARIGAVLVPVNFMLKADEIAYLLEHSGAEAVIAQDAFIDTIDTAVGIAGSTTRIRIAIAPQTGAPEGWTEFGDALESGDSSASAFDPVGDDEPIRLMYTSGTESRPKGAIHSSRSLMAQYVGCIVDGGMTGDDIDLHTLPFYHCAQLDCFLGPDVYLGATSVILPAPDPSTVLRKIEEHKVTKFFAPPTVWISLLRSPDFDTADLSSLVKGYYGASAMPVEVLKEIQERLPNLRLWNFYGQTELAPVATILPPEEQTTHAGSAGRPVLNVETKVVDDDGNELPPGGVGEVVHRGPQVTLGYWNDPVKTAEAFAGGWFHTGDLGVFDDEGRLSIVDRKKDMIKTGGENVASREVEETLYEHPDVAEVAVFATPHAKWVETVTAAIVARAGTSPSAEDLRAHVSVKLARYKVPTQIHIVTELPKNPSGKILKRELRERFSGDVS
jgi:fatty-acyl-CoA synthase